MLVNRMKSIFSPSRISIPTRGLEEFFDNLPKSGEKETDPPIVGRAWRASELRLKSNEDLHKLWYVCLKERNMLLTEKFRCYTNGKAFFGKDRAGKVRKSMQGIKVVINERMKVYQSLKSEWEAVNGKWVNEKEDEDIKEKEAEDKN